LTTGARSSSTIDPSSPLSNTSWWPRTRHGSNSTCGNPTGDGCSPRSQDWKRRSLCRRFSASCRSPRSTTRLRSPREGCLPPELVTSFTCLERPVPGASFCCWRSTLPEQYYPVLLALGIAMVMGVVILILSWLLGEQRNGRIKLTTIESGMPLLDRSHKRMSVAFFLVAIDFIV